MPFRAVYAAKQHQGGAAAPAAVVEARRRIGVIHAF
jgi:hypothetical protein